MSQEKRKRGILIVFEGCDRSGKSTQSKLLYEFLKERTSVELLRFPDRTTDIGKVINQYLTSSNNLNDQCIHLLFSANRWELKEKIVQLLNSGTSVILDRYVYSGIAFSAAKGLDLEWCRACDKGLPKPDVLYFFQLELEQASKRGDFGQERYETLEMQKRVMEQFLRMKEEWWTIIDASKSIESINEYLKDTTLKKMQVELPALGALN